MDASISGCCMLPFPQEQHLHIQYIADCERKGMCGSPRTGSCFEFGQRTAELVELLVHQLFSQHHVGRVLWWRHNIYMWLVWFHILESWDSYLLECVISPLIWPHLLTVFEANLSILTTNGSICCTSLPLSDTAFSPFLLIMHQMQPYSVYECCYTYSLV